MAYYKAKLGKRGKAPTKPESPKYVKTSSE